MNKLILLILMSTRLCAGDLYVITETGTELYQGCYVGIRYHSDIQRLSEYHLTCQQPVPSASNSEVHTRVYVEDSGTMACSRSTSTFYTDVDFYIVLDCREDLVFRSAFDKL